MCRFNTRVEDEIQPETERFTFFSKGTMQITPTMQGYAELGYFQTKSKAKGTLGANNDAGVFLPGDPFNPLFVHGPMNLPASHPQNTFGTDRTYFTVPYELGGRDQETNSKVFRGLVGLEGTQLWLGLQHWLAVCQKRVKERQLRLHHLRPDAGRAEQRHLLH